MNSLKAGMPPRFKDSPPQKVGVQFTSIIPYKLNKRTEKETDGPKSPNWKSLYL